MCWTNCKGRRRQDTRGGREGKEELIGGGFSDELTRTKTEQIEEEPQIQADSHPPDPSTRVAGNPKENRLQFLRRELALSTARRSADSSSTACSNCCLALVASGDGKGAGAGEENVDPPCVWWMLERRSNRERSRLAWSE
jgi:hypothetical protein